MLKKLIRWSISNRFLVLVMTLVVTGWGWVALQKIPLDAIPDLSDAQVIIRTSFPGQSPRVVEEQVTYPITTTMLSVPGAEIVRGYFERSIRSRNGYVLVCEDGSEIVGYMLSRIEKNIPVFEEDRIGYLSDAYLDEPYRIKGWGTIMWNMTLEWFTSKGVSEISLRVLSCNPGAREAYLRWGFKDVLWEMRYMK